MSDFARLEKLCGLEPNELAEIFENNPRAYMAVKGAVAEKHLHNYFEGLKNVGKISDFRTSSGDFEKDFYITLLNGEEIIVECKNVEVQKYSTKSDLFNYLVFVKEHKRELLEHNLSDNKKLSSKALKEIFNNLPQSLRGSGISRYEFSALQIEIQSIHGSLDSESFLRQFNHSKLSIDFQRTRNSRTNPDINFNGNEARFYRLDEIDIVAACLFTRTMKWEFVFGSRESLIRHKDYKDRYSNRLTINPKLWRYDFLEMV